MHLDSRLLIFSKYPVPGKAKTRLIPALGPEGAAQLHRRMAEAAVSMARSINKENPREGSGVTVYYTGAHAKKIRAWLGPDLQYKSQSSGDLGERMQEAFRATFAAGANNVIGIGTDVPTLSSAILHQAQKNLENHDIVLGPAADGGYYLIGMNALHPELFADIEWGTERVYTQTVEVCTRLGLRVAKLPTLSDIDRPEDLNTLKNDLRFSDIINSKPLLSVIIPTLNEAAVLGRTLQHLRHADKTEIMVVDGGSEDNTAEIATQFQANCIKVSTGRADQLNEGVRNSNGRYLLFLHADTLLPHNYDELIRTALDNPSTVAGAFRFKTDVSSRAMRIIEWGTNFRSAVLQWPYGDQGLFMERRIFDESGGFPAIPIMEDFELIRHLRRRGTIVTLAEEAITSARRWKKLGIVQTTIINQLMISGFLLGMPAEKLRRLYRRK